MKKFVNIGDFSFQALHIGGAVVTLVSVALMACSDVIQAKILDRWSCCNANSRDNSSEQSTDFADEETRLHLVSSNSILHDV